MGVPRRKTPDLLLLAQFHDIGKVGISDVILNKPGPLAPDQVTEVRRHCEIGSRLVQIAYELDSIADLILKHHEWWDGNGYPLGIFREQIPIECRILSVAIAYEAMINNRPYRKALSHHQAVMELIRCAGTQFDPRIVPLYIKAVQKFHELAR